MIGAAIRRETNTASDSAISAVAAPIAKIICADAIAALSATLAG